MKAYWVARSKIIDPENYKKYTDLVPDIVQKYSGNILARGGDHEILAGTKEFHRFVIIEFPTIKHGKKWEVIYPHIPLKKCILLHYSMI